KGEASSTTAATFTPCAAGESSATVENTTCLARYGSPVELTVLSALARLLATAFSRCDCAVMASPAILNIGFIVVLRVLRLQCSQETLDLGIDERERGLVAQRVVGELRALDVHIHGVVVDAGL